MRVRAGYLALVLIALPATAPAQEAKERLAAEIAQLRADIDWLRDLHAWQENVAGAAESDPGAVLEQRRPVAECAASILQPICAELTALFRPPPQGPEEDAASTNRDEARAVERGEGAQ